MLVVLLILALIAFTQLIISLFILLQSRRSGRLEQKIFVALCASTFVWTIINASLLNVDANVSLANINLYGWLNRIGYCLGTFSVTLIYLLNLLYPVRKPVGIYQILLLTSGVVLSVASFFPAISGTFNLDANRSVYSPGSLTLLIGVFSSVVLVSVIIDNLRFLHKAPDKLLRKQSITLLIGLLVTVAHAIFFLIILPSIYGDKSAFYVIGYFAPFYFTSFTIYGLLRQGLFDVRLIVARSVAYILLVLTLGGIYVFGAYGIVNLLFEGVIRAPGLQELANVVLAISLVFTFQPLKRFFEKITDSILYRDHYDTQKVINQLSEILVSQIDIDVIAHKSLEIISSALKLVHARLIVLDENKIYRVADYGEKWRPISASSLAQLHSNLFIVDEMDPGNIRQFLEEHEIFAALRLKTQEGVVGYMLLGPKQSGGIYSDQDAKLLEIIEKELAIALQNARSFEKIADFNLTLQDRIKEATKHLAEQNKRLKELDEAKDEFISMASHQLRTPLTAIKGYISMLAEGDAGKLNEKQSEFVDLAYTSAERMVYLISDMLNVSRINTGKLVIDRAPTDLVKVVKSEIMQLERTAEARKVVLQFKEPKHKIPILNLDEGKMRQVIMNFLDNAVYYAPNSTVEVSLEKVGEKVRFLVRDHGIGVPKTEQKKLFSKFFRANNAKKARPDGTGLGLYMAKIVIEMQGGDILFSSQEGQGSTFGFELPIAIKPQATKESTKPKAVAAI